MSGDSTSETYFESYEDLDVHRLMLSDNSRTETYKNVILSNKDYFKDKVVMDVGAGTGILSVFCAQVGAKKVYAVEASVLATLIDKVAQDNNVSHIIQVLHSRVEDIKLPEEEKVDVIVSEWMGFYLLHEGMLDSVLIARDQHLKVNGKMFPQQAVLYACPCRLPELSAFWEDVHGVNMSAVGKEYRKIKSSQPEIMQINPENLLAKPTVVCDLDLAKISISDLDRICSRCSTVALQDGSYQGLAVWFSCIFPSWDPSVEHAVLSTSPSHPLTHWKQTAIVMPTEVPVQAGELIMWDLQLLRSDDDHRHYNMKLTLLDPEEEKHPMPCYCHWTKCIVIRTFLEQNSDELVSGSDCESSDVDEVN